MKNNRTYKLLSVFRIKSLSVYQLTLFLLIVSFVISVGLFSISWAYVETNQVKNDISKLRETAINRQKEKLKAEASRLIHYLDHIQYDTAHHSVEQLKSEVLAYFEGIRFGNDGYVFVNTFDGLALLFDGKKLDKPTDMTYINFSDSINLFETELELSKLPVGGSFQYTFKKMDDTIQYPKMSYIMGFKKWNWIVGVGDYLDNLDKEIAFREKELKSGLYRAIKTVLAIFIPVLILLILISALVAKSVQKQFNKFVKIIKSTTLSKADKNAFAPIFIRELKAIAFDIAYAEERVKQFGNIIDQSNNEIYIFNQDDLHFVHANKGAIQNCGYSKSELIQMTPLDLKTNLNKAQFLHLLEPLKNKESEQIHFENVHQRKDKSLYPVDVHLANAFFYEKPVYIAFIFDITARKQAENLLFLSEQRLFNIFKYAPISLWEGDYTQLHHFLKSEMKKYNLPIEQLLKTHPEIIRKGAALAQVLDVNDYTVALYQAKTKDDLLGSFDKVFVEDSYKIFGQSLVALMNGDAYFSAEEKNKTLEGKEMDMLIRWSFMRNEKSKSLKVIISKVDLTGLRKTEQELKESEERFRSVFNNSHTVMLLIDPENARFIDANPAAIKFYGYTYAQFINSLKVSDLNLFSMDQIQKHMSHATTKKQEYFHFEHRLANGEMRNVEVYSGPISYQNKTVLFSIVHDSTEKRRSEKALIEAKNKLESIFRAAPTGIGVVSERIFTEVNDRFCEMTGYSSEELIGKESVMIYSSQKEFEWVGKEKYEQIREKGTGTVETQFKRKDGKIIDVLLSSTPIVIQDFTKGVTFTALDITDRKNDLRELEQHRLHLEELVKERTEALSKSQEGLLNLVDDLNEQTDKLAIANKRLSEINEELETFTYSVSHDLKAPLRGIDGYSQLLLEEYETEFPEEAKAFLMNIRNSSQQMNLLIEDLLTYSRMERKDFQSQDIELRPIIDNLLLQFSGSISENKVKIITSIPEKFSLFVDKDGLTLILRNLLDNALKFSIQGDKPKIEIGGSEDNEKWLIFVKDNGIGFDMKYHDRIFKIFQRLHLSEEYEGTGIGLAMVSKAVQRMNGKIWAESEVGKGATFFLEIGKV